MPDTTTATMDPQLSSFLVQIPLEILIRITYFISTTDLGNVRLSCRALEQSLFNFFSHEFFRKKQFMVSTDSLQALIDIAKHPTLSPALKHVIICADRVQHNKWVQDRNDEARARLEIANADHMHLLSTGGLRDMLADAFAHLANLETVDIRDFQSPSRSRDGYGALWRSYGAVTLAASTDASVNLGPRGDQDPYPSQIFGAVTTALAVAEARPKSIEVLFRSGHYHAFALYDTAFYIPPRMEASMSSLLAGLQSLHLTVTLTHHSRFRPFIFQKFLSMASNLTWLRLNFNHTDRTSAEDMLSWLALADAQSPPAYFDMPPIHFRHLERLDLGTVEMEPKTLLSLAAKFAPTLTSLYLRRVTLFDKNFDHRSSSTKVNPWVGCLSAMAKLPGSNLRVLDLASITHSGSTWRGDVTFKTIGSTPPSKDWTCSTHLVTMDKAIAQATASMVATWPLDQPDPMDEDDSEQEEEEGEEEEEEEEEENDGEDEEE